MKNYAFMTLSLRYGREIMRCKKILSLGGLALFHIQTDTQPQDFYANKA